MGRFDTQRNWAEYMSVPLLGNLQYLMQNNAESLFSCSVPDEYVPPRPCRLLPRIYQYYRLDSALGEIRGRIRYSDYIGTVSRA